MHVDFHILLEVIGGQYLHAGKRHCIRRNLLTVHHYTVVANCFLVNGLETHETLDTFSTACGNMQCSHGFQQIKKKKKV